MLYQLFSVIAPVFVCAVIGYIWRKQGRAYDTAFVTTLVTNIGTPCLVFSTLIDSKMQTDAFLEMGAATAATTALLRAILIFVAFAALTPIRFCVIVRIVAAKTSHHGS